MKAIKFLLLYAVIFMLASCKKDPASATVRYEFTATSSATYLLKFAVNNNSELSETIAGTTWTKTVSMTRAGGTAPTIARLTVYPPATWVGTSNNATVTLKIFVNDTQEAITTSMLSGADLNAGVFTIASF